MDGLDCVVGFNGHDEQRDVAAGIRQQNGART